jgi:hypothetical protein
MPPRRRTAAVTSHALPGQAREDKTPSRLREPALRHAHGGERGFAVTSTQSDEADRQEDQPE